MNLQERRTEFFRLMTCPKMEDCRDTLNIFADYFFEVLKEHQQDEVQIVIDHDAKIISQMIFTKILHINQLLDGIEFTGKDGTVLNNIIDPTVVASVIRNVYETVCMFNLIFRHTKSADEKLILSNLWVVASLKYRQRFRKPDMSEENLQKADRELVQISNLIAEIKATTLYNTLDEANRSIIDDRIKRKDYRIKFENNQVVCLDWQSLSNTLGAKESLSADIYTYFSFYSHPSHIAVAQFSEMFSREERHFIGFTIRDLKHLFMLTSAFIADYIHVFPNVLNTFESQPIINQLIINGQNTLLRGQDYSINEVADELGTIFE